jgi:hypothetical protein
MMPSWCTQGEREKPTARSTPEANHVRPIAAPFGNCTPWRDNSAGEAGFILERREGIGPFLVITRTAAQAGIGGRPAYADVAVVPGKSYSYRVRAFNFLEGRFGYSSYSSEARVSVPTPQ